MSTLLIWFDTVSIFLITLHKNIRPILYIYVGIFLMRDHIHWEERWTYLFIFLYHIARKSFSTTLVFNFGVLLEVKNQQMTMHSLLCNFVRMQYLIN
ncbi:hypothetical protein TorRG33x02_134260 [Trema orientale]|uniref:Uncharacterized protein n=1 Tax=Trema orientale TaxID=63057 RepID=A0A2P5EZ24_TREOI|nr:hypothetical protein TorRG33x02_134260 [Trema orientale]